MLQSVTTLAILAIAQPSYGQHIESFKLPGYGFKWYDPPCAFACYNALSGAPLECTSMDHSSGHSHGSGPTSPECRAGDTAFLTTLAYCMGSKCDSGTPTWKREQFWSKRVTGDVSVLPKWDYTISLEEVTEAPTIVFNSSEVMNRTVVLSQETYDMQYNFNIMFDRIEGLQSRYIFVILTLGFGIPILFALLLNLPGVSRIRDTLNPWLNRSLFRSYHVQPLPYQLGNIPTIGQGLYIFFFIALNIILSAVNYDTQQPHPWWFPPREEILAYIGYRTGHISYALLPLVILFSSRNNFLLWITNWSYGTYILLHRWVARVFAVQAIVHSITLLCTYIGTGSYPTDSKTAWWQWGIVATVLTCAMLVFSSLWFRRKSYEIFLVGHVIMAVFVIVGCWYHVILKWGFNFYDNWLIAASAVWSFDRLLRVMRMAMNGIKYANVTEVGDGYIRVDVPGLRWDRAPGYVAFAHFPTVSGWRFWENHPISVNATSTLSSPARGPVTGRAPSETSSSDDIEKQPTTSVAVSTTSRPDVVAQYASGAGVTLIIKHNTGLTKKLKPNSRLLTLLDGPYRFHHSANVLKCDRILLIGGGIGVTGLISWINAHPNVKLAWSVKQSAVALVREVDAALSRVPEKEVLTGERLDVGELLRHEAGLGYRRVGVVVCGPAGMCDDVRAQVTALGRAGKIKTVFELQVDVFSW